MAPAFYATELMLKTTADEHPNPEALDHLLDFLKVLDEEENLEAIHVALPSFTLKLLSCLGYSSDHIQNSFQMSSELSDCIQTLRQKNFQELKNFEIPESISYKLKTVINQLLEFVLERDLKSKAFLTQVN
jgi:recombinational DNA repair protein (RecF pathway)